MGSAFALFIKDLHVAVEAKSEETSKDDIDRLEKFISLANMEVFILGFAPVLAAAAVTPDGG